MADLFDAHFTWPSGPSNVIITGTFDDWKPTRQMTREANGSFSITIPLPWNEKIIYKFVVDGQWRVFNNATTEYDLHGNLNNVFHTPVKPPQVEASPAPEPVQEPSAIESLKGSALATEGAPTVTSYVVSGLGSAIGTLTGTDPLAAPKVPVEEPVSKPQEVPTEEPAVQEATKEISQCPVEEPTSVEPVGSIEPAVVDSTIDSTTTAPSTEVSAVAGANPPSTPKKKPSSLPTEPAKAADALPSPPLTPTRSQANGSKTSLDRARSGSIRSPFHRRKSSVEEKAAQPGSPGSVRSKDSPKRKGSLLVKLKHAFHLDKDKAEH